MTARKPNPMSRQEALALARAQRTQNRLDRYAEQLREHGYTVVAPARCESRSAQHRQGCPHAQ